MLRIHTRQPGTYVDNAVKSVIKCRMCVHQTQYASDRSSFLQSEVPSASFSFFWNLLIAFTLVQAFWIEYLDADYIDFVTTK